MSVRIPFGRRARLGAAAATVAGGAAAAAVVAQRHHLHALADDPEYAELTKPLNGRRLQVTSDDGTRLNVEVFGPDDAPTMVLAHGWTEQLSFWGPVIEHLRREGFRAVAYDLRGHGRSEPASDHDYRLDRFGDDVEVVLRQTAGDGHPTVVAGHSLGAMSIAAWAQRHDPATRADAAALINTGLGDLAARTLVLGQLAKLINHPWLSRHLLGARWRVPPFSTPLQQAVLRYAAFGPEAHRAEVSFYERMLIDCPADVRAAVGVVLSDMDLWDAAASLTIPTLVIDGDRDRLTPPVHAQRIVENLPSPAGLVELPNTGHMSPLERPTEVAEALVDLARRVGGTDGPADSTNGAARRPDGSADSASGAPRRTDGSAPLSSPEPSTP